MGTSLSGLTPATTFDGLLKVGDNDPLTATLKPISTGDGTDTMLELSTSALQIGGATGMYWDNTNKRLGLNDVTPTSKIDIKNTFGASALSQLDRMGLFVGYTSASFGIALGGTSSYTSGLVQGTNNIGNASGTLSLNPFGSDVGVGSVSPTAKLHVKGSGNTGATSSLLIQNSSASDLLRVNDSGEVRMQTLDFLGNKITSLARISTSGLAINNAGTSPDANTQLHVKGAGNTDATTSLLVQNSDGNTLLKVVDDGEVRIGETTGSLTAEGNNVFLRGTNIYFRERLGGYLGNFREEGFQIGNGSAAATARLQVKGSGATSATTSLLVQNSDASDLFKITDDRNIETYDATGNVITKNNAGNRRFEINPDLNSLVDFQVSGGGLSNLIRTDSGLNAVGIGANGLASTRFLIKGGGATSATTALLVENSSGTDTLEVRDDGRVVAGTGATTNANGTFNVLHSTSNLTTRVFTVSRDSVLRGMDINSGGSTKISDSSGDQSFSHTATAVLEVSSTTQGFLPPRMTGTQRDAIESPASGLIIYNTTTNKAQCYNGTSWNDMF